MKPYRRRPVTRDAQHPTPLFLASVSPRRRALLRALGLKFRILRPDWPEPPPRAGTPPARYAIANARGKTLSVVGKVSSGIVIGMDTVVVHKKHILGKPATPAEARAMLGRLSGQTHAVITGLALATRTGKTGRVRLITGSDRSLVTFRELTKREIDRYIATGEPFDKAGAYAIQGRAGRFVTGVSGSYTNIVGLPVLKLLTLLQRLQP